MTPVLIFGALAYAGAWLAMLPLLLSGFHRTNADLGMGLLTQLCIAAMMLMPALAAVFVLVRFDKPANLRTAIGLTRPTGRTVRVSLLALAIPIGIQLASLVVSALAGTYRFDLVNFSGFRSQYAADTLGQSGLPIGALLVTLGGLALSMLVWLPMFFGEELGWQGYLLPRLLPLGRVRALLITAVVVALWHLPTLVMGGQFPGHSLAESVGSMLVAVALLIPIFSWLRMRFGSVWPVVLAHTAVSQVNVALVWILGDASFRVDPMQVGLSGWPGWLVMGGFVAVLAATGQFRLLAPAPQRPVAASAVIG